MIRNVTKTLLAAAVLFAGVAHADGLLLSPNALPQTARAQLAEQIAQAKKSSPGSFEKIHAIAATAPKLDAQKRGKLAPMTQVFRRIGDDGLWPMVELIAFDAAPRGDEAETATRALEIGLVEAAGAKRDPRLAPVWTAILDGKETRFEILRASAAALAMLDTDAAAAKLIAVAKTDGVKKGAALAAMGNCRRLTVAHALATALDAHPDVATAKTIAKSLSDVGNAWAWKTPAVTARSEEGAVRQTAAEALLRAYVAYDGEARQAASNALLVVNAPTTGTLIEAAKKGASSEQVAALDALAKRWAANPIK